MKPFKDLRVGHRVEIHPGYDLWMQGARFGQVVKINGSVAVVRMDHPGVRKFHCFPVEDLFVGR